MSIPISQFIPPPRHFPPLVSIRLFSTSMSLFLPCKPVHLYHFSRLHVYVLIYDICFSLSDLLLPTHMGRSVYPKKTQKTNRLLLQLLCALNPELVAKPPPCPHSVRSPRGAPCPSCRTVAVPLKGSDGLGCHQVLRLLLHPRTFGSVSSNNIEPCLLLLCSLDGIPQSFPNKSRKSRLSWREPLLLEGCPGHLGQLLPHQDVLSFLPRKREPHSALVLPRILAPSLPVYTLLEGRTTSGSFQ